MSLYCHDVKVFNVCHTPGVDPLAPSLPPGHSVRHPVRPALRAAAWIQEHQGQEGAVSDAGADQPPVRTGGCGHTPAIKEDIPQPQHEGVHQGTEAEKREASRGTQTQLHGGARAEAGGGHQCDNWPSGLRRLSGEPHTAAGPGLLS